MKGFFGKYENLVLLLLLFLFASILLANNVKEKQEPNFAEQVALVVAMPIQKGATTSIRKVTDFWKHYVYLVKTSKENETLLKKLHEQEFQNSLLLEELKKYRRVENLLSFHPIGQSEFQVAGVVGWDSTNFAQTLVIDRGTEDKIEKGMVALTHQGLVGRIVSTSRHASRVLMITDARSAVDAYVQETRVRCIVVGQNRKTALIRYLPTDAKVKSGDLLISSGLGGVFPKGMPLGRITSIESDTNRLFIKAELAPSADLEHAEEVLVMLIPPGTGQELLKDEKK